MHKYNHHPVAIVALIVVISSLAVISAAAPPPNGIAAAQKTKAALEPDRPSTRTITVRIYRGAGEVMRWTGAEVRDSVNGTGYMATVMLTPPEARGFAILARQADNHPSRMWTYAPAVHRVEMLTPAAEFAPMFGSDFSFSDLGFMDLKSTYNYLGEATRDNVKTYKLEELPNNNPYYTKIIAWIRQSNYLPLERDFYDYTSKPIDIETYPEVRDIDGIPTVTRIKMVNEHSGNSTEFDFSDIRYGNKAPAALFNPENLPTIANEPFLKSGRGRQ